MSITISSNYKSFIKAYLNQSEGRDMPSYKDTYNVTLLQNIYKAMLPESDCVCKVLKGYILQKFE